MRFAGIDVASETRFVGIVGEQSQVLLKPQPFDEDAAGYEKLRQFLDGMEDVLVVMEATGHYWQNLFAALVAWGYAVSIVNPLRTRRFAEENLDRTTTDALDALNIARFDAQKRPTVARLSDEATTEIRELVRLRDRLLQDFGDRVAAGSRSPHFESGSPTSAPVRGSDQPLRNLAHECDRQNDLGRDHGAAPSLGRDAVRDQRKDDFCVPRSSPRSSLQRVSRALRLRPRGAARSSAACERHASTPRSLARAFSSTATACPASW